MAREKANWMINITIPDGEKEIIERWIDEAGVTKSQFMKWTLSFLAGEMQTIDKIDPDEIKTGISFPTMMLFGIRTGKIPMGGKNE